MNQHNVLILLRFCIIFLLLFSFTVSQAQFIVNYGANIIVKEGANVVINGSYVNKNDGAFDGKIDLDGNIILKRNWVNIANNEVLVNTGTGFVGNVIMDGNIKQFIEGTNSTLFENLILRDSKKILKVTNCKVKDTLTIDAILTMNANRIKLLNSKPTAIRYISGYILSETNSLEGLGEVEWYIGQDTETYNVPFGSGYDFASDLDVSLTTLSPGEPANGSITFATYPTGCQNVPIPATVDKLDRSFEYIADRFWIIDPFYITKPEVNMAFEYRTQDINKGCNGGLIESEMKAIRYNTVQLTWSDMTPRGFSNPDNLRFYIDNVSPDDFYAPWCLVQEAVEWELFFPSAFTPNGDGKNEFFSPIGYNLDKMDLTMYIYNRWGGLVYKMDDIDKPWDGRTGNSDLICPEGVYSWILFLKDIDGMERYYKGIVTLVK